jgi:hypothetical protein
VAKPGGSASWANSQDHVRNKKQVSAKTGRKTRGSLMEFLCILRGRPRGKRHV